MFNTEEELVEYSLQLVLDEFDINKNSIQYIKEPKGLFGRPDIMIFNGNIISIEYKLKNWKQAMKQAYRYQSFSEETYVVLDEEFAIIAKKNLSEFKRFNIGLCAVNNESIEFYFKPKSKEPFSKELMKKAMKLFLQ